MKRRTKRGRIVNGFLLLDKPLGLTSNAALQKVKRIYNAQKAGHTGSLDPLATGMLPICFGEATKFSQYLLEADKHYLVTAKLGVKTASGDAEGEILSTASVDGLDTAKLESVLAQFRGDIEQVPSMFSALKHKGQPLYKLARQGIEVERQPRPVHIYQLELLELEGDELKLAIRCSKGTYVRTLVDDIGDILGCGAHVAALRRDYVSPYHTAEMVTLEALEMDLEKGDFAALDSRILDVASSVANWPTVSLTESAAFYLRQGQAVFVPNTPTTGQVGLMTMDKKFLGVGEILDDGRVTPRRLLQ